MQNVWHMIILRTRKNIHMDAHPPELTRQISNVDIHPAGVFAAQSGEGAGVIRKHRYSEHFAFLFLGSYNIILPL